MVVVVDLGIGNTGSVVAALRRLGGNAMATADPSRISDAEKIILPGIGSFDAAVSNMRERGIDGVLRRKVLDEGTPILGICLGMQLMAEGSEEGGAAGLGWISGRNVRIRPPVDGRLKVPHMGWNSVQPAAESVLFKNQDAGARYYFVHSYHLVCEDPDDVGATTEYGGTIVSAVEREHVMGVQFHPEKSHGAGLHILKNFLAF